jgi:hypothetical protein
MEKIMSTIDRNTINPYIRVAMRSILPAGNQLKQRMIFDYELIYLEKGELFVHSLELYSVKK